MPRWRGARRLAGRFPVSICRLAGSDTLQWLGAITRPFRAIGRAVQSAFYEDADDSAALDDADDLIHDSVVEQDKLQDDATATADDDDLGPDNAADTPPEDDDKTAKDAAEKEEEGMWEETFKSHRDSKPHGQ